MISACLVNTLTPSDINGLLVIFEVEPALQIEWDYKLKLRILG